MDNNDLVLDHLDFNKNNYTTASKNKRFANYIIDSIGYSLFSFAIGMLLAGTTNYGQEVVLPEDSYSSSTMFDYLIGIIAILSYLYSTRIFFRWKNDWKIHH